MKAFIRYIILFFIFTSTAYSQNFWPRVASPTTKSLFKCCFTDVQNGWAVGDTGTIIHTSNGGVGWYIQDTSLQYGLRDVFFLNSRLGWAIGNDFLFIKSYILRTTNGGNNWSVTLVPDSSKPYVCIYFKDSLNGFIGGYNVGILNSTNSGFTWKLSYIDTGDFTRFGIFKFKFQNAATGFACGGNLDVGGIICKSTNSGLNWNCDFIAPVPLLDLVFLDQNRILSVGGEYDLSTSLLKSSNAGASWIIDTTFVFFGSGVSLAYRTPAEVWVPTGPEWVVSYDSARIGSWIELPIIYPNTILNCAVFADSLHGWAVGNAGGIYKFDTNLIGINPGHKNIPAVFRLYQNYPNPFNPVTTINFQLPMSGIVKLIIYDVLGREVAVLVDGQLKPGNYSVEWDGSNYPSGVYFCRLEASSYSESKKMVLVK